MTDPLDGPKRVGQLLDLFRLPAGGHDLHLADLVPAEPERDRILALDEQARPAAERGAEPREVVDG